MTVTTEEASAHFLTLLDQMTEGEPVTITRQGKPFARLVPVLNGHDADTASPMVPDVGMTPEEAVDRIIKLRESIAPGPPFLSELLEEAKQHSYERNHGW